MSISGLTDSKDGLVRSGLSTVRFPQTCPIIQLPLNNSIDYAIKTTGPQS
ncbi:12824_t:CDS:2 [Ambispora gerdemannii]|uniref:12824_t:CDS:1 n=1 Tax=Ambispora gerdemannii TaxID=144530 RepID=A0A9N9AK33_9GLOM|nr:12824_t:CDS:2 [Ambispora gerdemannii]